MVDGLFYDETLRGDFATVAYRIQLLGFNAIRIPFSFLVWLELPSIPTILMLTLILSFKTDKPFVLNKIIKPWVCCKGCPALFFKNWIHLRRQVDAVDNYLVLAFVHCCRYCFSRPLLSTPGLAPSVLRLTSEPMWLIPGMRQTSLQMLSHPAL